MPSCPILTYHSQLIFGNDYHNNSHVALAEDLQRIRAAGKRIVSLNMLVDALILKNRTLDLDDLVCITFDDGADFDWHDIDHPEFGPQTGFAGILQAYGRTHQGEPLATATSFVLASPGARQAISRQAMQGRSWMNDDWWLPAKNSGILDLQSHGWDHRHPCLSSPGDPEWGHFFAADNEDICDLQIISAADDIARRLGGHRPDLFAYPYGQASDFLRYSYFPEQQDRHGFHAAFSTVPEHFHQDADRWFLPRYVHVEHWKDGAGLESILRDR